jgi:hypothetical protein
MFINEKTEGLKSRHTVHLNMGFQDLLCCVASQLCGLGFLVLLCGSPSFAVSISTLCCVKLAAFLFGSSSSNIWIVELCSSDPYVSFDVWISELGCLDLQSLIFGSLHSNVGISELCCLDLLLCYLDL